MAARAAYRFEKDGFVFVLDTADAAALPRMADFEGREEPAVAEEFLRFRAEAWADSLAAAGAAPGEIRVRLEPHQRKVRLLREERLLFTADI
jgi:hypothetical protein